MSNFRDITPDALAEVFKALANPHRLAVFLRLAGCCRPGTRCDGVVRECVGALGKDLGIAASTVSHHLKELNRAGLIHMARSGQTVECWVEPDTLDGLSGFFHEAGGAGRNETE